MTVALLPRNSLFLYSCNKRDPRATRPDLRIPLKRLEMKTQTGAHRKIANVVQITEPHGVGALHIE